MANNSVTRGLIPEWTQGQPPRTQKVPLPTSGATVPLFIGSPVLLTAGYPAAAGATGALTGAVVELYDSNGCPTKTWPINTGGWAEITTDPNQVYTIIADAAIDTTAALVLARIGAYNYNTIAETSVAATTSTAGSNKSAVKLGVSTAAVLATPKQLTLIGLTPNEFAADGTVTGAECRVVITTSKYQA